MQALLVFLMLLLPITAIADDNKTAECVVINGEEFCKKLPETSVMIGDVEIQIKNPLALLNSAKGKQLNNKFKKISLWERFDYPPFIVELAFQNNMKPQELIDLMATVDKNWLALKQFSEMSDDLYRAYSQHVNLDQVMETIMRQIIDDILKQSGLSGVNAI